MTISRKEKQVPKDLAPARLYLDDLEMVIRVFQEAKQSQTDNPENLPRGAAEKQPSLKFEIENQVCTELADLPKIAETTHNLSMEVEMPDFSTFLLISPSSTHWDAYALTSSEEWSLHSKIEPIFRGRERPLIALVHKISPAILWLGLGILGTLILFPQLVRYSTPFVTFPTPSPKVPVALALALILLLTIHHQLASSHTVVVLRHYSESSAQRRESSSSKTWDLAKILLGAVLVLLAQYILGKLFH